jgi:DNA-directed RNA polymerase subunit RPC12/RpoP
LLLERIFQTSLQVAAHMKFPFTCSDCGHVNHAVWSQVGQQFECFRCGESLTVPAPMESIVEPAQPKAPQRLKFRCPACRRKFATKHEMAGQKIRCTGCGAGVRVPWAEEAGESDAPSSQPAVAVFDKSDEIALAPEPPRRDPVRADVPRVDVTRAVTKPAKVESPIVKTKTPDFDAIAYLDTIGGSKPSEPSLATRASMIELARNRAAEESVMDPDFVPARAPKTIKKKRRKKQSSFFDPKETLKLVGGVGAVVAVLGFLAWAYPDFRMPLGGLLCLIGFVVYVLGAVSLRQLVAEEGFIKLMLFRFCPPYQWWFIFSRWDETRDFFAFFMAGAIVMSLGGAIIKVSPLSIKAEADEQAYQQKVERRQADLQQRMPAPAGAVHADHD